MQAALGWNWGVKRLPEPDDARDFSAPGVHVVHNSLMNGRVSHSVERDGVVILAGLIGGRKLVIAVADALRLVEQGLRLIVG